MRRTAWVSALALAAAAAAVVVQAGGPVATITFADVHPQAGIHFVHNNGAFGKKYLPETIGSGVVFFDDDGDGWQDCSSSTRRTGPGGPGAEDRLGPVPQQPRRHVHGRDGAVGTRDADVRHRRGRGRLRQRRRRGPVRHRARRRTICSATTARDASPTSRRKAGVGDPGLLDERRSGSTTTTTASSICSSRTTSRGRPRRTCSARSTARPSRTARPSPTRARARTLYHNLGDGTFEDVTRKAGLFDPTSKALGVAMIDYDGDGCMDLFVANDTQPNRLYRNKGDGTFEDVAVTAGVAFGEAGVARAGMGVDAADYDGSGRPSLIIGNFSNEMMALYHNEGNGLFIDEAPDVVARPRVAADADVRLLLLRLRSRRPARHLRGQRPRGGRHQQRAAERHLRRSAAALPQHGQAALRRRQRRSRRAASAADRRARGRLRRHRPRRRPRRRRLRRTAVPAKLLRNDGRARTLPARPHDRHGLEPRRHRRARRDHAAGGAPAVGDRQDRLELRVAERAAGDVRPRRRDAVASIEVTWPGGKVGSRGANAGGSQTVTIEEGRGASPAARSS